MADYTWKAADKHAQPSIIQEQQAAQTAARRRKNDRPCLTALRYQSTGIRHQRLNIFPLQNLQKQRQFPAVGRTSSNPPLGSNPAPPATAPLPPPALSTHKVLDKVDKLEKQPKRLLMTPFHHRASVCEDFSLDQDPASAGTQKLAITTVDPPMEVLPGQKYPKQL
ncbi:MD13L polymerase, partial [Polypterus senegalus]